MTVRDVSTVHSGDSSVLVHSAPGLLDPPAGTPATASAATTDRAPHSNPPRTDSIAPLAAVAAGCAAIALLLLGTFIVIRAGLGGAWRAPIAEVAGYEGTAVLGMIVLGVAVALLGAALSGDRSAILLMSLALGVAGATIAIEPTVGGELLAVEADLGVAVLVVSVIVAFVAAVAPSAPLTTGDQRT